MTAASPFPLAAEPPGCSAGFTLLELLVALALAALLMAAVPAAMRLGARSLSQAEALTNDAADRAALGFVAERMAETMALYERGADGRLKVAFTGNATSIGFVAPATMDPRQDPPAGLFLMELAVDDARMLLRWQPFRPGLVQAPGVLWQERELLGNVVGLSFRYFGAPAPRVAAAWTDVWPSTDTIPELIEMQITRRQRLAALPLVIRVPLRQRPVR